MTIEPESFTRRLGIISSLVVILLGTFGILGWISGFYLELFVDANSEPMSPVGAIGYIILGSIMLILAIPLKSRFAKWTARILCSFIMVISGMFLAAALFIPSLDVQKVLVYPIIGTSSPVETTIAPLATFAIFIAAIALTRMIYMRVKWRHYDAVMGILSMLIFSIGFLGFIGYAFGNPEFYGGSIRAVSLSSSLTLIHLGFGIMALIGPSKYPLSLFLGDDIGAQMRRILIPIIVVAFFGYSWIVFQIFLSAPGDPIAAVGIFMVIAIVAVAYTISYISTRIRSIVDKAQNEKTRAIEALALANKKLDMLDSLTRHDILNQISLASIEAELTRRMSKEPRVQESAENIARINKTIVALLQFSKEYKRVGAERPRWMDIEEVISKATEQLERGNVTMDYYCINWKVYSDPMIEKAFFNILENSLRHGEKVTGITVECGLSKDDGALRIVFSDNGVGIPEAEKESIFEKGVGKNTGLGLFLVRQILSITDISIRENGVPGKGARFEITVPKGNFEATPQS